MRAIYFEVTFRGMLISRARYVDMNSWIRSEYPCMRVWPKQHSTTTSNCLKAFMYRVARVCLGRLRLLWQRYNPGKNSKNSDNIQIGGNGLHQNHQKVTSKIAHFYSKCLNIFPQYYYL